MKTIKFIINNSDGYTLIEIIIVMIIIATLSTIAILNISGFTQSASDNVIITNMRSLISEIEAYAAQNRNYPGENVPDFDTEAFIQQYKDEFNALDEIVEELGDYEVDNELYYYEIENDDYVFSVKVNENYLRISKSKALETDAEGHLRLEDL